jgi:hypothetical protein
LVLYIGLPLIVESIGQEILTPTPRRALGAVVSVFFAVPVAV